MLLARKSACPTSSPSPVASASLEDAVGKVALAGAYGGVRQQDDPLPFSRSHFRRECLEHLDALLFGHNMADPESMRPRHYDPKSSAIRACVLSLK